jgi:hypothetical protein
MAKKEAAKKTHNDLDDLPPEEPAEEYDEESASDVLGIDVPKPKGEAKADALEEPDERPGEDVLAAVAAEAAADAGEDEVTDEGEEDADEPDEGVSEEPETPDPDEPEPRRVVKFERDGEVVELDVTETEAQVLESIQSAAETTRDKYAHLQGKYLEAIQAPEITPAEAARPTPRQTPAEDGTARLNQMMGAIPQVIEAYAPVVKHVAGSLPEDNELREFIEDQPVVAAILAAMWDGQNDLQAQGAQTRAERGEAAFKNHVDGLITNIINSEDAGEALADAEVRDKFDEYLVTLGPIGADGRHDPTPVRATLMRDDGTWLNERWSDFQLRAALAGAKPAGGGDTTPPPTTTPTDAARRRAIDPGGGSRSGSRPQSKKAPFSKEVSDVLGSG